MCVVIGLVSIIVIKLIFFVFNMIVISSIVFIIFKGMFFQKVIQILLFIQFLFICVMQVNCTVFEVFVKVCIILLFIDLIINRLLCVYFLSKCLDIFFCVRIRFILNLINIFNIRFIYSFFELFCGSFMFFNIVLIFVDLLNFRWR